MAAEQHADPEQQQREGSQRTRRSGGGESGARRLGREQRSRARAVREKVATCWKVGRFCDSGLAGRPCQQGQRPGIVTYVDLPLIA